MAGRKGATFGGVSDRWPFSCWAGMEGRCHSIAPPPQSRPWGRGVGRSLLPARPPKSRTPQATSGGFLGMMVWGQEAVREAVK